MYRRKISERRKTQRLNIPLQIKYRFSMKKRMLTQEVFVKDISGGGIGLTLEQPLKVGIKLNILVYFPGDKRPVSSLSKVIWCRKKISKRRIFYDVGIRYIKIKSKDRERFVFLFCETMINSFLPSQNLHK